MVSNIFYFHPYLGNLMKFAKYCSNGLVQPPTSLESQITPRKINIEPENDGLEDDFPFPGCILRFHVNLPGCKNPDPFGKKPGLFFGSGD